MTDQPPENSGSRPLDQEFLASLHAALGRVADSVSSPETFAGALLERHPSALRLRYGEPVTALPVPVTPIPWYPLGFRAQANQPRPSRTIAYAAGTFYLQDAGSMLALAACDADQPPPAPRLVCDLCAAPGGKASAVLESIGTGFLLANEVVKSRLAPLTHNLARTGSDRYAISNRDPEDLAERLPGVFDLVLADVPCSGQALLGKGRQTLSAVSTEQIEHSARRARRILTAALRLLRPGGQLVFSTCTFAEAENEAQVRWMCESGQAQPAPVSRLSSYTSDSAGGAYRLWPHRHGCAGSFAASLQRQHQPATEPPAPPQESPRRRRAKGRGKPHASAPDLRQWWQSVPGRLVTRGDTVWGWPEDAPGWVESIAVRGPELAYRTGQTWKPSHQAAMRRTGSLVPHQSLEVGQAEALAYLSGAPIACHQLGWVVVTHQGRPLGWIKASAGRGKNQLPAAARFPPG